MTGFWGRSVGGTRPDQYAIALSGGPGIDTWYGFTPSPRTSATTFTDINPAEGDFTYSFATSMGRIDNTLSDPALRSLARLDNRDSAMSRGQTALALTGIWYALPLLLSQCLARWVDAQAG